MQIKNMTEGRGVAQWVMPKKNTANTSRPGKDKENRKRDGGNRLAGSSGTNRRNRSDEPDNHSNTSSLLNENPTYLQTRTYYDPHSQQYHSTTIRHAQDEEDARQQQANKIDDAICKTICVIVEQYLKELRDHQRQINEARSKLIRDGHSRGDFIAHTDMSRLNVRDEQTKAIGTIKQLTNYLKELSTIKRQENSESDSVSEEIHNKLSDLRHEIISTLNDFVLANGDIDVPIVDLDDPTGGRDYDLCIEAQRSNRDVRELEITNSLSLDITTSTAETQQQQLRKRPLANRNNGMTMNDVDDDKRDAATIEQQQQQQQLDSDNKYKLMTVQNDYQLIEVDKRRREINKLEKDTVELRNLFADFYTLVKTQGEQVDTIEDNLVMAAQHISEGRSHLSQAARPMRGLTVLLPMTGCITGALIGGPIGFLVGGKLGSITIICASSLLGLLSSLGAQKCIETGGKMR